MPLDIDALLVPISAEQPSGADLRYSPVTDKIKEARRQEENLAQGVWEREVKTADYVAVIKLAKEALIKQSKDLQIAAWLTEALLAREGFPGLRDGLQLMQRMLDTFWDSAYPQIDEDGDLELRATPLSFVGRQLDRAVRSAALTQAGHGWYQYRESRSVPNENDAMQDGAKQQKRAEAIAEGQVTPEEFDKGLEATPVAFSQQVYDDLNSLIELTNAFSDYCDQKFGDASPEFVTLKKALEEVQQTSRILLIQKGGLKSGRAAEEETEPAEEAIYEDAGTGEISPGNSAAVPQRVRKKIAQTAEPTDESDAIERLLVSARFLRHANPFSPAAYMIPRALRWGELRSTGGYPDAMFLAAPSSEIRVELKRLAMEGQWDQVIEKTEEAAGLPCGRAWIDLQRYAVTACRSMGMEPPAIAIISGLRGLIADFPQMTQWTLADDTPAANPETMQWLTNEMILGAPQVQQAPPQQEWFPPPPVAAESPNGAEPAPPDAFELAMQAARSGRIEEALDILMREISQERSGRARFLRRIELAQVCLATGNQAIALPILEELSREIESRGLEAWENAETIAQPLALLYRGMPYSDETADQRQKLYARICRLDPARALTLQR